MSTTGDEQLVSANIELACVVLKAFSPVRVEKAFCTANYRANGGWTLQSIFFGPFVAFSYVSVSRA